MSSMGAAVVAFSTQPLADIGEDLFLFIHQSAEGRFYRLRETDAFNALNMFKVAQQFIMQVST